MILNVVIRSSFWQTCVTLRTSTQNKKQCRSNKTKLDRKTEKQGEQGKIRGTHRNTFVDKVLKVEVVRERTEREGHHRGFYLQKYSLEPVFPSKTFRLGHVLFRMKYSFNLFMPKKEKKIIHKCKNKTRLDCWGACFSNKN